MYGVCAAAPAGPSEAPAAVVTLAGVLMLAALTALEVVVTPRGPDGGLPGPGTADDGAVNPTEPTATTASAARMPRLVLFRRDLVMSG